MAMHFVCVVLYSRSTLKYGVQNLMQLKLIIMFRVYVLVLSVASLIPFHYTLYNYHPCCSVTRRFVSQRKVRSPEGFPEGDLTFRGETNRRVTTPTRMIIGILYRIFLHQTSSNRTPADLRKYSI